MKNKFSQNIYEIKKKDFYGQHTNNLLFTLFPNDDAASSLLINGIQYEDYMFDFFRINNINAEGHDIIDIGANNGNFSVDFGHMVGDTGRVFSYEPQRIIYYQLCANVFMNGLDNVFCHNLAIGDKNNVIDIEVPDYFKKGHVNFGNVLVKNESSEVSSFEKVAMYKLDSFTFNKLLFIKMDIQGYEPYALDGAYNTIQEHRPYMMIEFEEPNLTKFGLSENDLTEKLHNMGYVICKIREGQKFNTYNGECLDRMCIPTEKMEGIKIP